MARKRVETEILLNWEGVSTALAQIGGIDREIARAEQDMQQKIDALKLETAEACRPLLEKRAMLEAAIASFADGHRDELGDKKSKTLYFGTVGYRKSSKVLLPRAAAKIAEIVIRLRARKMADCIVTPPETVDKEALKKYAPEDIEAVGARLDQRDVFWYEVDQERLTDA